jgi:hypothetical protein
MLSSAEAEAKNQKCENDVRSIALTVHPRQRRSPLVPPSSAAIFVASFIRICRMMEENRLAWPKL